MDQLQEYLSSQRLLFPQLHIVENGLFIYFEVLIILLSEYHLPQQYRIQLVSVDQHLNHNFIHVANQYEGVLWLWHLILLEIKQVLPCEVVTIWLNIHGTQTRLDTLHL